MAKEILWSEDQEYAYGRKGEFASKEDFIQTVKEEHEDLTTEKCSVVDVKTHVGLYTDRTLEAERVVLLEYTNIQMENWYVGRIEEVEDIEEEED
ncbi:hypothetical protein EC604_01590 [Paenibacillus amylolyticus]|jgi:hypothetical protein|uniref:Uncharacterized protein n=1 Tax=Paenibacillus amylolyticus TaxID=1451 RepID=A0A5M9WLU4_PAEAM|nr:hypothetical protein [Paenibacillus amylolyticus]KAA8782540.1 hypothetical protein EC604_01590 [Paenibacillus amylolyticus]